MSWQLRVQRRRGRVWETLPYVFATKEEAADIEAVHDASFGNYLFCNDSMSGPDEEGIYGSIRDYRAVESNLPVNARWTDEGLELI